MSLFTSIQLAKNSLIAQQIGLQVTGNNIANANTPGYIRQRVVLNPAPTQEIGNLVLGLGVEVTGVVQQLDRFLADRLRTAISDLANSETQEDVYRQLETILGELNDSDLSTSLTSFFGSLNDILNQPESVTVRNLAVLQGEILTDDINRLDSRVRQVRSDFNNRVITAGGEINGLLEEVARLNVQIVAQEGGDAQFSDAVGLRDRRQVILDRLAKLIDVRVQERDTGAVTVYSGSDFLVAEGSFREVKTVFSGDRGLGAAEIQLTETDAPLTINSGEIAGLIAARDEILGGFLDQLDDLANTLVQEFNQVYSGGQGLNGYNSLTSEHAVDDLNAALDQTSLPFTPVNGSFRVQVRDRSTGLFQTTDVIVALNGLEDDTTLTELATSLDAIDGLNATLDSQRRLTVNADSANIDFSFADDTSGVLAALGLGTFFSGTGASDIAINDIVREDPSKFSASGGGIGEDVDVAVQLANFLDRPLESKNGDSLAVTYDRLVAETVQSSSVAASVAEGFRVFQRTLEGGKLGTSGVSIDEEAVNMLTYQRAFQASARFIRTVSELLDTLVNL